MVFWRKLFNLHRIAICQHMRVTWGSSSGVRFAAQVKTYEVQGRKFPVPTVYMRTGTPCRVWPLDERRETEAGEGEVKPKERVAQTPKPSGRREVVMVRDLETGQRTLQMRIAANTMSERERLEARNAYRAAGGMDEGTPGADPPAEEQAKRGPESDQESQRQ